MKLSNIRINMKKTSKNNTNRSSGKKDAGIISRKNGKCWQAGSLCLALIMALAAVITPVNTGMETVRAGDIAIISWNGSDNLEGYIRSMTLQKKNDAGEWVDMGAGEDIVLGNNYRLKVHFEGGADGFQTPMKWSLGNNVTCTPVQDVPIWDDGVQIGTYSLTEDGQVTVELFQTFLEGENQELDMTFDMVPTRDGDGGDHDFPWSGHITDHNIVDNTGVLDVEKTAGYYSASTGSITYTVEASVTAGMVKDGTLKDVMKDGLTFRNIESMKVYDANNKDVTEQYQEYIDDLKANAEAQKSEDEWTLSPLPPLSQGMKFVVEYKGEVDEEKRKDKSYTAENTVTFSGNKPNGKPADPDEDTAEKPLAKDQLAKTGDTIIVEEDGKEKEVIQWQVKVGSGQWDPLESDLTMVDTLGEGLSFRTSEKIQVQRYDMDGNPIGSPVEIDWKDVTISEDGKEATYELYKKLFSDYTWKDGDYLMVTYNTDFDRDKQPQNGFENTVKNDILSSPEGTTGRLPVGEAVQKTVVDNEKERYLTYTVVVDVPPASHMKAMDKSDGHGDLGLPYFYIEDRLDFGDDYFALNVPENVSIVAEGKSSSNRWTFDNVPCTSGTGDNIERETFQILDGPNSSDSVQGKNRRAFRIYFNTARYGVGTDEELERHDSIWDIDEATRMTITYNIPYDTVIVDQDGKDTGLKLGDLLNQGEKLENRALSRRSGVDLDDRCYYEKPRNEGSIDKKALYLSDGVVEYRVTFENDDGIIDTDGSTSRLIKTSTFDDLKPTLEDTFDERMEYVPGSLKVEVRSLDSNNVYAIYQYTGEGPVKTGENILQAKVADFGEQTQNDGKHYLGKPIKDTFDEKRKYVFVYQLRLKDEYRESWKSTEDIKNTATFQYGDEKPTADANIDIPSDMLQKDFKATKDGTLEYTLNVNSLAADLVSIGTGEGSVNLDSYKLVDEMSENLQLVEDPTTNDYKITVQYFDETENAWKTLERSNDPTGISREKHNYFKGSEGEANGIYFILPDELHIRITYEVIVNGAANSQELAVNTATLYADHTETDQRRTIFEVGESGATGSSDPVVHLEKNDSETGTLLPGAEFILYSSKETSGASTIEAKGADGKSITLYQAGSYTTDENGAINKIVLTGENASNSTGNTLYALVEIKAPEGYLLNPEPYFFRFFGSNAKIPAPETVTYVQDGQTYEVHYEKARSTIVRTNEKKQYLRFLKVDAEGGKLGGANFSLYACAEGGDGSWSKGDLLYTGVSNGDGVVQWAKGTTGEAGSITSADVLDLPDGSYYVEETSAPSGYQKLKEPIIITVKDGKITGQTLSGEALTPTEEKLATGEVLGFAITFTVKNEKVNVSPLRIIKKDMSETKNLSDAVFELYATKEQEEGTLVEDVLLWTGKSDENGVVQWHKPTETETKDQLELAPGIYHLRETKAPDSYNKLEDTIVIEVTEDGTIQLTGSEKMVRKVSNEEGAPVIEYLIRNSDGYTLPETGGTGTSYLYVLGGIFLGLGAFLLRRRIAR